MGLKGKRTRQIRIDLFFRRKYWRKCTWTSQMFLNRQDTMLRYFKWKRASRTQTLITRYFPVKKKKTASK